jgi:hypothetical protein
MWAVVEALDVRPTVLKALVDNGADVNVTDHNGETVMFGLVRFIDHMLALRVGALNACGPAGCRRRPERAEQRRTDTAQHGASN